MERGRDGEGEGWRGGGVERGRGGGEREGKWKEGGHLPGYEAILFQECCTICHASHKDKS